MIRIVYTIHVSEESQVCPGWYVEEEGDIPQFGTDLGSKLSVTSREECAERCDRLLLCLSFEHSNTEQFCNLNRESLPTKRKYKDYVFCRKNGKNHSKHQLFCTCSFFFYNVRRLIIKLFCQIR